VEEIEFVVMLGKSKQKEKKRREEKSRGRKQRKEMRRPLL